MDRDVAAHDLERQLLAARASVDVHRVALERMQEELSDVRADRDRAWTRVKLLEGRNDAARSALEGK